MALPETAVQDTAEEKPPAVREKATEPGTSDHPGKEQTTESGRAETKVKKQFTRKEMSDFGLNVRTCAHCGKDIIRGSFDGYAYKRHSGGKMHYFCSWSCFRADERKTGKTKDSYCY